ncbi:MAG: ybhL [Ignavibacteria bacterium]|nr:ybhL [Ignavibacteria bacterium]
MNKENIKHLSIETLEREQGAFMSKVYGWMVGGLLVTAAAAYYTETSGLFLSIVNSSFFYIIILAEFGLVLALSGWIEKMSVQTAAISFITYSLLNGLTLAVILVRFTDESIYMTFSITAVMFGALSMYGYATKKSLSGFGSFLFMGLAGVVIASFLQIFFYNSALSFAINIIGILVFAGLTAYDTQRIKEMFFDTAGEKTLATKAAIIGALMLYLDFINLFLFLLRLFGRRD